MPTSAERKCTGSGNPGKVNPKEVVLLTPMFNAISRIFRLKIIPFLSLYGILRIFVEWEIMRGWLRSMEVSMKIGQKCFMTVLENV